MLSHFTTIISILTKKTYDEIALNEKEGRNPDQFNIANNELPKWLKPKK